MQQGNQQPYYLNRCNQGYTAWLPVSGAETEEKRNAEREERNSRAQSVPALSATIARALTWLHSTVAS